MSEYRKDPITGRWIIITTERGKRINEFVEKRNSVQTKTDNCSLCEGYELKTPNEIFSFRKEGTKPNSPGWFVRVVPNKFPIVKIEGSLDKTGVGIYDTMNGLGIHELIIETPNHNKKLYELDINNIKYILTAYKSRIDHFKKDLKLRYVLIFKNEGDRAGASISHSHSQIIALPIVPKYIEEELKGAGEYFDNKERCVFCDIIKEEINSRERLIIENNDFISFSPFASRFPFEICIIPKKHSAFFSTLDDKEMSSLSLILKETLQRVSVALKTPNYNLIFHIAPMNVYSKRGDSVEENFHWHIEIMPRIVRVTGFEWASSFYVNPISPEEATRILKLVNI